MALLKLRDYQQEALKTVQNAFKKGISNQLIVLPTGSGKTIIMASIARHFDTKVLLLAHREELIKQAKEKFKLYWPTADIGICKAKQNEISKQIVIGSVQSCYQPKRLKQLKEQNFDILMIDEAHHTESSSYQKIIVELGFKDDPSKLLLGVTATPDRADKKNLGDTFDKIVFSRSIGSMIRAGYLPPVIGRRLLTTCSLKGVKSKFGDFIAKQLSHAVNTTDRNQFIVDKYKEHASNRKAVAFCVDVAHTKALAATFKKNGVKAAPVWGTMPKEDRERVLKKLHTGTLNVVTSCELLTEGFDEETISAIIMARPTKSKSLYIQMVGRGLRKHPTKENCLVLDFTDTGNNLKNVITLTKAIPEAKLIVEQHKEELTHKRARNFNQDTQRSIDQVFDILGSVSFMWVENGSDELSLTDDHGNEIVVYPVSNGFMANLFYKNGSTRCIVSKPLPLNYCIGSCEDFAREYLKMKFADISAPWLQRNESPTPGQLRLLEFKGLGEKANTRAQAAMMIRAFIAKDRKQNRLRKEAQWKNVENSNTSHKTHSINSVRA